MTNKEKAALLKMFDSYSTARFHSLQARIKAGQYVGYETGRKAHAMHEKWEEKAYKLEVEIRRSLGAVYEVEE